MPVVTAIKQLETCLDSSRVAQFELDGNLDETCMYRTAEGGKLSYFPDFPRPYFCVRRSGWYVVQGILGDKWLRVTFLPNANLEAQSTLIAAIAGPDATPVDEVSLVRPSGCYPAAMTCEGAGRK